MAPPRKLNLEAVEDRTVPAVISISYIGSTWLVQASDTRVADSGRAAVPTVSRAEVFRVNHDNGASQYLVRVPSWSGGWNQYLLPTKPVPTRIASANPPSLVRVPFAQNTGNTRTTNTNDTASSGEQAQRSSSPLSDRPVVSVPVNLFASEAVTTTTNDSTASANASVQGYAAQAAVIPDTNLSSARPSFLLVGSIDEIVLPADQTPVPTAKADAPAAEPELPSQSAEPPMASEPELPQIPEIAVQIVNNLPVAGLIPFNFAALENGVRSVMDRVANLDETWVEEASGVEDYLWTTAGALVAAGVVQAAWSRRSQLTDRRVLGRDSVLARWGGLNDGRLRG